MGNQIIRQPSGTFAIFSTVTGTIVAWDASESDIVAWFTERDASEWEVRAALTHVAAGAPEKIYAQFAMTWEEALAEDRRHGGTAWREEVDRG